MDPTPTFLPTDQQTAAVAGTYGSFLRRLAAAIIDGILLGIVNSIIGSLLGVSIVGSIRPGESPNIGAVLGAMSGYLILSTVVNWLYSAYFESSARQATIGKAAMSLIVTDEQGQRISFMQATIRFFSKIISGMIMMIGYLMQPFTQKKQALHDIIAKTLVWKRA